MEDYDTPELRAEWVEDQLRDNRFLYEFPDDPKVRRQLYIFCYLIALYFIAVKRYLLWTVGRHYLRLLCGTIRPL